MFKDMHAQITAEMAWIQEQRLQLQERWEQLRELAEVVDSTFLADDPAVTLVGGERSKYEEMEDRVLIARLHEVNQ